MKKVKYHPCPNKKCLGNFNGMCRQVYFQCYYHMTTGTEQHKEYIKLTRKDGIK